MVHCIIYRRRTAQEVFWTTWQTTYVTNTNSHLPQDLVKKTLKKRSLQPFSLVRTSCQCVILFGFVIFHIQVNTAIQYDWVCRVIPNPISAITCPVTEEISLPRYAISVSDWLTWVGIIIFLQKSMHAKLSKFYSQIRCNRLWGTGSDSKKEAWHYSLEMTVKKYLIVNFHCSHLIVNFGNDSQVILNCKLSLQPVDCQLHCSQTIWSV